MPGTYRARCLVLKKTKLGETDTILTMLSADGGQVRAVAKGLRKPGNRIGARLEPFSVCDILLHRGRSLDIVGETRCVATNAAVREDLLKTAAADAMAELLEKSSRDGALVGERVFPLTTTALAAIGAGDPGQAGLFSAAHLFKAMAMQGFRPAIHMCALCGRPLGPGQAERMARFDVAAGGALCEDDAPEAAGGAGRGARGVDPALVGWLDRLVRSTFAELSQVPPGAAPTRQLLDLAEAWARVHLSLNLRSMSFLKTLS